jgi:MscS family membrane protein
MINDFFQTMFMGNSIKAYAWFVAIILIGFIFQRLLSRLLALFVFKFLQKYATGVGFDRLLSLLKKPMGVFIMLIAFYSASSHIDFPKEWEFEAVEKFGLRMIIYRSFQIGIVVSITWILLRIVDFFGVVFLHRAALTPTKTDDQMVPFVKEAVKILVCIFSLFFILGAIFNLNVASLVAGLGIGGLAIALAAKETLENLIGSFTIFIDKPFAIGDTIKVGAIEGQVEHIGFRSTRIRTVDKSFLTVPNKKLIDNELDNFSLRTQRRANFNITLNYTATSVQLKNIIAGIKECIEKHPSVAKSDIQVRLFNMDNNAQNIMILYFVDSADYNLYLDVREDINYKILDLVEKNGATFFTLVPQK